MSHSRANIQRVIVSLGYDFTQFNLQDFVNHLEYKRNRKILLAGVKLKREVTGMWIPAPSVDYVFFNDTLHPVHQTHAILHELAHMVLNHTCQPLSEVLSPELLAELKMPSLTGRLRTAKSHKEQDPQEVESEWFVFEIQKRVVSAQRISELQTGSSSITLFRPLADGMAFED